MENTNRHYFFLDEDYKYTDQKTGLLRNLRNITNAVDLVFFEHSKSSAQIEMLEKNPISVANHKDILTTHYAIFKDVYPFAGQPREVIIQKQGTPFAKPEEFEDRFKLIDKLISEYKKISLTQPELKIKLAISEKLAEIINAINWTHCFREGNGRTQRTVATSLAFEYGYELQINVDKDTSTYQRYFAGTAEKDNDILASVIYDSLTFHPSLRKTIPENPIQKYFKLLNPKKLMLILKGKFFISKNSSITNSK